MYKNVNMSFSVTNSIKKKKTGREEKEKQQNFSEWGIILVDVIKAQKEMEKKQKKTKHRPTARYVCVNKTGNF